MKDLSFSFKSEALWMLALNLAPAAVGLFVLILLELLSM